MKNHASNLKAVHDRADGHELLLYSWWVAEPTSLAKLSREQLREAGNMQVQPGAELRQRQQTFRGFPRLLRLTSLTASI
jgi:hypothetical protein